jgi:hypothetical protein
MGNVLSNYPHYHIISKRCKCKNNCSHITTCIKCYKNECNNYTAPFLTYIPSGTPNLNVDIENELK